MYIAEGYQLPNETIGQENYVFVQKGMVAQRALSYDEISTEYILFLDDDLYLPEDAVEKYKKLRRRITSFEYNAVLEESDRLGFDGYSQERTSATKKYTPDF